MGLFKKRETDPAEIERLKAEIASMGARLNASDAAKSELDHTVRGLASRLETATPPPPAPPTPPPPAPPEPSTSEFDLLNARVDRLSSSVGEASAVDPAQIDDLTSQMQRIGDRIDEIDQRITSISIELANQITELSGDIDGGGERVAADDVVDELRDAQTRLASEQARYQIAFRQDLAELVDRLRRA